MKKLLTLLVCLTLILSLSACGNKDNPSQDGNKPEENSDINMDKKLADMIKEITDGIELPQSEVFDLDDENFESFAFIKKQEGMEGVASEAQILTMAHSLVLVRTQEKDTENIAKEISENANPIKWICVEAEAGKVFYGPNYVFLVMTYKDDVDSLKANFEKVTGIKEAKSFDVKSQDMPQ